MTKTLLLTLFWLLMTGCGMQYQAPTVVSGNTGSGIGLRVAGNPTQVEIDEGDSLVIVPTLTAAADVDVDVQLMITSSRGDVASFFPQTLPLSATIPAGDTSVVFTLNTNPEAAYTGDLTFVATLSSPQLTGEVNLNLKLKDQQPLTLGSFTISGVADAAGTSDTTADNTLVDSLTPKIAWSSSSFAEEYRVSILEDDGTTVKCSAQTAADLEYDYAVGNCQLSVGQFYRASVVAKTGAVELAAPLYRFQVLSTAALPGDTIMLMSNGAAVTFDPRTNDSDSSATILGVSTPSAGTASFTGNSVTYTPDGTTTGVVTFTYSINDSDGNPIPGTITVKLMTPFTWTGAVSDNFTTSGNWCGAVTTPGPSGACSGGAAPNSTQIAVIDATCSGSNCNPVIADGATITVRGIKLSANTLTKTGAATLTVSASGSNSLGFVQNGGTFIGGTGNMTMNNAAFILNSGIFTAPSGVLKVHLRPVTIGPGANFNHGGGTFQFSSTWSGDQLVTPGNAVFHHVTFNSEGDDNFSLITGTLTVSGNLDIMDSGVRGWMDGGMIKLAGNLTIYGKGHTHGSTVIELTGNPAGQTVHGVAGGGVSGLKIATGTHPVTFSGTFKLHSASLEVVSVGSFTSTGNTLRFGEAGCVSVPIIPGNIEYNNVELLGGCQWYTMNNGTMKINGNFALKNDDYLTDLNDGIWEVKGNVDLSSSFGAEGTGSVRLVGNPAGQTIIGGTRAQIPRLEIDTGSHDVIMNGKLAVFRDYKVSSVGILTPPSELILDGGCYNYGNDYFKAEMGNITYPKLTLAGGCPAFDLMGATVRVTDLDIARGVGSELPGEVNNGTIEVSGDLTIKLSIAGSSIFKLIGNSFGQTIYANRPQSDIPNLVIAAGTNPVTLAGTGNLRIRNDYSFISGASFDVTGKTIRFGVNDCNGDAQLTLGPVTYENIILDTYCRDINISDSIETSGNLSIISTGTVNMLNLGGGHFINVGGTYTKSAGSTLNLNGVTLNP